MALYHIEKYVPEHLIKQALAAQKYIGNPNLRYSQHIQDHFNNPDHKHFATLKDIEEIILGLRKNPVKAFEYETDDKGKLIKFCIRTDYDYDHDVSIAIMPHAFTQGVTCDFVKTAWINKRSDTHTTLDLSKYAGE